jgi:uncharacterized phage-associated protein
MPYDSIAIANYLIEAAKAQGEALTPMKVQKLVYFAHGWNLAIHDQPLLNERIEAWKYGPVVPELYRELKEYGSKPIPGPVHVMRFVGTKVSVSVPKIEDCDGPIEPAKQLLDRIWVVYGKYTAIQLSNATHAPGSPWDITWKRAGGASHAVIDDQLIKADFLKRAHQQAAPAAANA